VKPLIPEGYNASLTALQLTPEQVLKLKFSPGTAIELMYEPGNPN
jgi:hypothetical protein